MIRGNNFQPRILSLTSLSINCERRINIFLDMQDLKLCISAFAFLFRMLRRYATAKWGRKPRKRKARNMGNEIQQKCTGKTWKDGKEMYQDDSCLPGRPWEKSPWSMTGIWKATGKLCPAEEKKYDRLPVEFDQNIGRGILVHWQV